jgi:hypothetical protein
MKLIELLLNWNTGKKFNFERDIIWGVILTVILLLMMNIRL